MKRLIVMAMAATLAACGEDMTQGGIDILSATLAYDGPAYAGLERHEVMLLLRSYVERRAVVSLSCSTADGTTSSTTLSVVVEGEREFSVGLHPRGRCVTAGGTIQEDGGEAVPILISVL